MKATVNDKLRAEIAQLKYQLERSQRNAAEQETRATKAEIFQKLQEGNQSLLMGEVHFLRNLVEGMAIDAVKYEAILNKRFSGTGNYLTHMG